MNAPELEYLVTSGGWSAGGLAIGYVLGRVHARLMSIDRHLTHMDNRKEGPKA